MSEINNSDVLTSKALKPLNSSNLEQLALKGLSQPSWLLGIHCEMVIHYLVVGLTVMIKIMKTNVNDKCSGGGLQYCGPNKPLLWI